MYKLAFYSYTHQPGGWPVISSTIFFYSYPRKHSYFELYTPRPTHPNENPVASPPTTTASRPECLEKYYLYLVHVLKRTKQTIYSSHVIYYVILFAYVPPKKKKDDDINNNIVSRFPSDEMKNIETKVLGLRTLEIIINSA
ncbi:hypothetical protein QTP88_008473 [Uroleucon formosanum]